SQRRPPALAGADPAHSPAMTEPLTRFRIKGTELAVQLAGDRGNPPLLLVHGFPASSKSFRNIIEPLARDCFVIAPDLPGYGESPPLDAPSFARFADLLDGLLQRLAAGSCHLYLHDYGAAAA